MSKLTIVCNGDSWCFGSEICDPTIVAQQPKNRFVCEYDFFPNNDEYRTARIWPTHLGKILGANVVNLGWPADDNGTILQRTINYLTTEYLATGKSTDDLLVIVGWSSPERNSFWYKDDKLNMRFRVWPNVPHFENTIQRKFWEMYVGYLWNAEEYLPRFAMDALQLQTFCDAHGIKWMCFNSFYQTGGRNVTEWADINIKSEIMGLHREWYQVIESKDEFIRKTNTFDYTKVWNLIDPIRFYRKDQPNNTFKSFIEQCGVSPVFYGFHPSPDAHEAWAKHLAGYIAEHQLLSDLKAK